MFYWTADRAATCYWILSGVITIFDSVSFWYEDLDVIYFMAQFVGIYNILEDQMMVKKVNCNREMDVYSLSDFFSNGFFVDFVDLSALYQYTAGSMVPRHLVLSLFLVLPQHAGSTVFRLKYKVCQVSFVFNYLLHISILETYIPDQRFPL